MIAKVDLAIIQARAWPFFTAPLFNRLKVGSGLRLQPIAGSRLG